MDQELPLTQEILQRLDALALKLGTTAEYLWPALVREAAIQGWTMALLRILLFVVSAALCASLLRSAKRSGEDDHFVIALGITACAILINILVLCDLGDSLGMALAPEAAALRSILP